jgi:WD40-like Beta Propeller Repeat
MRTPPGRNLLALVLAALAVAPAAGQYDTYFGQNKIAYDSFKWNVYHAPHFDVYYYAASAPFLDDIVSYSESAYVRLSKELDHELRFRIPMIIYKTHSEFEETNISLEELPEEVGAFAEPIQNRMVLPIDQPPDKLYALISHELTHIFQYSMFFEGYVGRALRARIPQWLIEGMASYFGRDEENFDRMVIRDAVVNNVIPPIQSLDFTGYLNYRYGHAVFDFIEQKFGKEGVRNFVYEYRKVLLSGNIEKAVKEAFGIDIDAFNREFNVYLRKKYFPVLLEKKSPDDYGKEVGLKRPGIYTFSPTLSPSGELIAALATPKSELDLVVLSAEDGKLVRNLTKGWTNRYRYLVTEVFSGKRDLSWSPTGDQIAVFVRKENRRELAIFDALHGKLERMIRLKGIAQCASPAFSPDGSRIAFEGNKDGVVDIFEIDLKTRKVRNLTQDDDYDSNPWYAPDGKSILYDRRIGPSWKIFSVDVEDPARKTQLTFGTASDIQPSYSRDGKSVLFASDRGAEGIFNVCALDLASGETKQYTDVVGGCFAPVETAPQDDAPTIVFAAFFDTTFRLFRMPLKPGDATPANEPAAAAQAEAEPFKPPLRLKTDAANSKPYKPRWDIEAPSLSVGLANDGTFLSNVAVQFADLLGDHRVFVNFYSVSSFSNFVVTYTNLKHRFLWGGSVFDLRDYYLTSNGFQLNRRQVQRNTGLQVFGAYPINRYYRVGASITATDSTQDYFTGYQVSGGFLTAQFVSVSDRFLIFSPSIVGDTTRFRQFGPFQGKRFKLGVDFGQNIGSGLPGNIRQYTLDFRAYKQLTRRSVLAYRALGIFNKGEREIYYGIGGLNDLRGYDFRSLFGSNVAEMNVELRFPFIDELRFPIGPIRNIRGFLFLDAATAWLRDKQFYDPDSRAVRANIDFNNGTAQIIPFRFWDSAAGRPQDLRASYGAGFQFFFLGGLQFNWAWAKRLPYTRYVNVSTDPNIIDLQPVKADLGGVRTEFYITYDW